MNIIPAGYVLKSLAGEEMTISVEDKSPFTVGRAIASILAAGEGRGTNPKILWNLATRLFEARASVNVLDKEMEVVKKIVESYSGFSCVVTGQILELLENNPGEDGETPVESPAEQAKTPLAERRKRRRRRRKERSEELDL